MNKQQSKQLLPTQNSVSRNSRRNFQRRARSLQPLPNPAPRARIVLRDPAPRPRRFEQDQVGAVVKTRLTRLGMSDIRSHRLSWVIGYTFVGNGTNGTANSVYFQTASSTYLIVAQGNNSSGQVPIAASDLDLGATYASDIEKHFARKVVKRMWIHIDSLQPSTSNNMMCVLGVSRGPGGMAFSTPAALATASVASNTVNQVSSMAKSIPVDSWEHKTLEITEFIAGGSGPKQNEFEIQGAPGTGGGAIYTNGAGNVPDLDGDSLVPACFAIAGNNTTAALQNTKVHQISIEQEIDLLDYVGGMSAAKPIE